MPPTAAELTAARAGVTLRGGRIVGALGVLAALTALGGLLGAWVLWLSFRTLPRWLASLDQWSNGDLAQLDFAGLVPNWTLPALLILTLLGTALCVWAILVDRKTVGAVRDQTLSPSAAHLDALERSALTVRPWITLGQIAPIVQMLLPLLALPLMLGLMRRGDPQTFPGLGPLETATLVLGILVQGLPTLVITWLILGSVRRWLDAVVQRARRPLAVRPAARALDPWLLFTVVLLVLGLAGLLLGGLPLVAVSAFVGGAPLNDPQLAALGVTPAALRVTLLLGAAAMLGGALFSTLLILLMAWSRGFATNVATVLDSGLPGSTPAPIPDPWNSPPQPAQARDPS
ncbi:hypothetical protein GCM10008949_04500 [Deinococcus humi]|nr:hypothetical protein GCM10008949_04500 [Deinococcus humi]